MPEDKLPSLEEWMTADEVASWLGCSTRQLATNRIPHAKMGERRFYNKHDVARWLEQRRDKVNPD